MNSFFYCIYLIVRCKCIIKMNNEMFFTISSDDFKTVIYIDLM